MESKKVVALCFLSLLVFGCGTKKISTYDKLLTSESIESIEEITSTEAVDFIKETKEIAELSYGRNTFSSSRGISSTKIDPESAESFLFEDHLTNLQLQELNGNGVVNSEDLILERPEIDQEGVESVDLEGGNLLITNSIRTSSGRVKVEFHGRANQKIQPLLKQGLIEALEKTNAKLREEKIPRIKRIYISSTIRKGNEKSNHYNGSALDISRINGVRMINYQFSLMLNMDRLGQIDLHPSLKTFSKDYMYLFPRVLQLQTAIEELSYRRENFGPAYKTKYFKKKDSIDPQYFVPNHQDHIHFSVRQ